MANQNDKWSECYRITAVRSDGQNINKYVYKSEQGLKRAIQTTKMD